MSVSTILRAVASKGGMADSPIRRGDYQITGAVEAGWDQALVLKTDATVWGWGANSTGQLGTGGTGTVLVPTQAAGLSGVVAISMAADSNGGTSLALQADGTLRGWGRNNFGQTGVGYTSTPPAPPVLTPTPVPGLGGVVAVAAGIPRWHSRPTLRSGFGVTTSASSEQHERQQHGGTTPSRS
jgi:hypothetical protein